MTQISHLSRCEANQVETLPGNKQKLLTVASQKAMKMLKRTLLEVSHLFNQ